MYSFSADNKADNKSDDKTQKRKIGKNREKVKWLSFDLP